MKVRSGREWVTLVGVAIVAAVVATVVASSVALTNLYRESSLFWMGLTVLPAGGVGVTVGALAGIKRWWLVLPAACALLGVLAAMAFAAAQALGFLAILLVATGLAAGALFAVVLVDLLTHRFVDGHDPRSTTGRPSAHRR